MAKASSKKTTLKLDGSSSGGTMPCNICHGTGRVQKKKKK